MADTSGLITGLDAIGSIDRTADLLEIVDISANTSFKVTVNNLLGISGLAVGTTDTQALSNKTLGNTNVITVFDGNFTLQDNIDPTKQAQFQLSTNTTGTTRIYTLPDASGTVMDLTSTQTATNKTFTAPTITGGTLTNVTISANTLIGFTTSNTGSVYGITVTAGVITSTGSVNGGALVAGTVASGALATNAVQANQLATNAITLGYVQATTVFTTASTTAVQVTGLTLTVTIPSGGRRIKITVNGDSISNSAANDFSQVSIWDGTVGTGTNLGSTAFQSTVNGQSGPFTLMAVISPAAGSKTYNIGFNVVTGGTGTLFASTNSPVLFLVEVI